MESSGHVGHKVKGSMSGSTHDVRDVQLTLGEINGFPFGQHHLYRLPAMQNELDDNNLNSVFFFFTAQFRQVQLSTCRPLSESQDPHSNPLLKLIIPFFYPCLQIVPVPISPQSFECIGDPVKCVLPFDTTKINFDMRHWDIL